MIALSSSKAEYRAFTKGTKKGILLKKLTTKLSIKNIDNLTMF